MPFSRSLTDRIRHVLHGRRWLCEKTMFGGRAFMLRGNMLVGVWHASLIVRLGPEAAEKALTEPDVFEFDVTGTPMRGWVVVEPDGIESDAKLNDWIDRATAFNETLPKK